MNRFRTTVMLAMVLTAITTVAYANTDVSGGSATDVLNSYSKGTVTRDAVKTELSDKYAAGTLTKADLKIEITSAYNHNVLKRDDLQIEFHTGKPGRNYRYGLTDMSLFLNF